MKNTLKTLLISAVFALGLTLTACGSGESVSAPNTADTNSSVQATSQSEQTEPEPELKNTAKDDSKQSEQAADVPETTQGETVSDGETVLVVYFSHTGTTREVSNYLHGIVGGDLIEIEPVDPYPAGYSDALDPAKQEQRDNARPAIANSIDDFDKYETIYLGYPIWWGTTPMIINTFLESYDFSGKIVLPYATSGGTGISKSIEDIRNEIPNADVKDGLLVKSNEDISPWLENLGMI